MLDLHTERMYRLYQMYLRQQHEKLIVLAIFDRKGTVHQVKSVKSGQQAIKVRPITPKDQNHYIFVSPQIRNSTHPSDILFSHSDATGPGSAPVCKRHTQETCVGYWAADRTDSFYARTWATSSGNTPSPPILPPLSSRRSKREGTRAAIRMQYQYSFTASHHERLAYTCPNSSLHTARVGVNGQRLC